MTELMIERIKNASSLVGKILCSAYYNIEYGGEIAVDSDRITGYKVERGELYLLLENNKPIKDIYVNTDAIEIEFYPFHKEIVLSAHSTHESKAKEKLIKIKEKNEDFENLCNKILISPKSKYYLRIISKYKEKNGTLFNIDNFIENSFNRLKNADEDFKEFCEEQTEI